MRSIAASWTTSARAIRTMPSALRRMSLIEEGPARQVRMAHLAVVGAHRTNGVAAIHSELLRTRLLKDFAEIWPDVHQQDQRRHAAPLAAAGQSGARTPDHRGDRRPLGHRPRPSRGSPAARRRRRVPHALPEGQARCQAPLRRLAEETTGQVVDPETMFDSQIKRIHAYKRQLLNLLHIVVLYNRLRADPGLDLPPRTFFLAGKAAPAYRLAKLIIKLANSIAATLAAEPAMRGRINLVFVPNYGVTVAQRLIPASDVSEQISTAGYEASGTSNMKLMMNGALDRRHARWGDDRDRRGGGRGQRLPVRPDRRAGGGQPRLVQPLVALPQRARDPGRARPDPRRPFQPGRARDLPADLGHAADRGRLLHAPGRPLGLCGGTARVGALYAIPKSGPARRSSTSRARENSRATARSRSTRREIWGASPARSREPRAVDRRPGRPHGAGRRATDRGAR